MKATRLRALLGLLGLALLGACASAPPPRTLLALPPTVGVAASTGKPAPAPVPAPLRALEQRAEAPLLVVRRLAIPEHLQSRRVRFRADASTLGEWPDTVWAERIEAAMTREFVAALRPRLPGHEVCEASCGERLPTLSLTVELQPLDFMRASRRLQAHARIWLAASGREAKALGSAEFEFDLPAAADTPQAQAEAMSELLRQLAAATAAWMPPASR